jgi:hypothetical protein
VLCLLRYPAREINIRSDENKSKLRYYGEEQNEVLQGTQHSKLIGHGRGYLKKERNLKVKKRNQFSKVVVFQVEKFPSLILS